MTNNNPIYVVVKTAKVIKEKEDFYVYSKKSSNKAVMIAYAEEIKGKYPHANVYLMTREKAQEKERAFYYWRKEQERKALKECDKRLNELMTKMIYKESVKKA